MSSLSDYAKKAVADFPDSDIEIAMAFCDKVIPEFVGTSNDRLVKVGRSIKSLVDLAEDEMIPLEESLKLLVEECSLIQSGKVKVPKVRFGKTELQMPIVTLGCMRFQQMWGPTIDTMNKVGSDCQDNLVEILKTAILEYGINHIETARGYGCSELQLGTALKQLFMTKQVKREDLIIQTKIAPFKDVKEFRDAMELSFKNLQVDYIDLFAFHGMNYPEQLEWVFDGEDNCLAVVKEYMAEGKIRHLGFSTHGSTQHILNCINKDVFEYVNLHYHYFGSYTASGGGHDGNGNLDCVKLLKEKDMGIFIISPFDKGGRLYAPSRKLRSLTLPEMEPMDFKCKWIFNHHLIGGDLPQLHTFTAGAARPSDLDQPAVAAYLHATKPEETLAKVQAVTKRLDETKEKALGKQWLETWWKGLPKASESKFHVEHNQIVWCYNSIKAFGLYEFAKSRYLSFEHNGAKWDDARSAEENINEIGKNPWGFVPGIPLKPGVDYSQDFVNVPKENLERVKEAEEFVVKWCAEKKKEEKEARQDALRKRFTLIRRNFSISSQMFKLPRFLSDLSSSEEKKDNEPTVAEESDEPLPKEWETAYDMRPWPDYPEQPPRV